MNIRDWKTTEDDQALLRNLDIMGCGLMPFSPAQTTCSHRKEDALPSPRAWCKASVVMLLLLPVSVNWLINTGISSFAEFHGNI